MTVALAAEPVIPVRPLSLRELLDLPFAVVAVHIARLAAVAAVAILWAEALVIAVVLTADAVSGRMSNTATQWVVLGAALLGAWLVCTVMRGFGTVIALAEVRGERLSVRGASSAVGKSAGPMLLAAVVALLQGLGVLLLAIPIVTYPFVMWWLTRLRAGSFLVLALIAAEGMGFRAAVTRSKDLVQGAGLRMGIAWLALRALLVLFVPPVIVAMGIISDFSGTERWAAIVLCSAAILVAAALLGALEAVMRVASYVDRRCRREAIDIRLPG